MSEIASEQEALAWCRREFGEAAQFRPLPSIDHAFTHFDLRLNPLRVRCEVRSGVRESADRLWYQLDAPPRIGLPQPILRLFEQLRANDA